MRSHLIRSASREMLVISRQNGLRLLSSRLSGYRQKIDGHALIGRCDDLRTDRLRVKLKDLRGRVPVGRFFSLYYCWLLHRADVLHLPITSRFTFLLSFSACVNGRDVRELDDLFVVLLLVYREPSS